MAKGVIDKKGHRKVAISFPEGLFKTIDARAKAAKTSFSAEVVDLVKCGLLDVQESEALEPNTETRACH